MVDQRVETLAPKERIEGPEQARYLECIDQNCAYYGLVKVPKDKQRDWGKKSEPGEIDEFAGIRDAECPGCHSTRTVHIAEEIAPDVNNPEVLQQWLEKYTVESSISFAHLSRREQQFRTIQQGKIIVQSGLKQGVPHDEIKSDLVDFVSHDYPQAIPISEHK